VQIDHPRPECAPLGQAWLRDGGVASSSVLLRQWVAGGERQHHVIDPFTGHPTRNRVTGASVIARSAWMAEVLATGASVDGRGSAIARSGAAGALVPQQGDPEYVNDFAYFVQ
jgi:thiamine biosynthesis lipoprotein